jgi:hypothetical protein
MSSFNIKLDDKPYLNNLRKEDIEAFKSVVGTFVSLMEIAAEKKWHQLPKAIHTSLSFNDVVGGVLNAVMTTKEIDPEAYATLEYDLHPLALISDKRKNIITDDHEPYDWMSHFSMDTNEVSKETLEKIIRKLLYLVRWFDIDTVSKSLVSNQFPVIDGKDIMKLPFQPALKYQKEHLGDLYVGKFLHDIGALNCGPLPDQNSNNCPSCIVGELKHVGVGKNQYHTCPRCNAGFVYIPEEELDF